MDTITATRRNTESLADWRGSAHLYQLDRTVTCSTNPWGGGDDDDIEFDHIVVSAAVAPYSGPETYVFAAEADGTVISWGELPGSFRGALDHDVALRGFIARVDNEGRVSHDD